MQICAFCLLKSQQPFDQVIHISQWLAIWDGLDILVIKPGSGTYSVDTDDDLQIRTPILRVMSHCNVWVQKGTTYPLVI